MRRHEGAQIRQTRTGIPVSRLQDAPPGRPKRQLLWHGPPQSLRDVHGVGNRPFARRQTGLGSRRSEKYRAGISCFGLLGLEELTFDYGGRFAGGLFHTVSPFAPSSTRKQPSPRVRPGLSWRIPFGKTWLGSVCRPIRPISSKAERICGQGNSSLSSQISPSLTTASSLAATPASEDAGFRPMPEAGPPPGRPPRIRPAMPPNSQFP